MTILLQDCQGGRQISSELGKFMPEPSNHDGDDRSTERRAFPELAAVQEPVGGRIFRIRGHEVRLTSAGWPLRRMWRTAGIRDAANGQGKLTQGRHRVDLFSALHFTG